MKILVTGRAGQLARSLAERAGAYPQLSVMLSGRPDLDLERPETLAGAVAAAAPDLIINAAAYTAVDQAEDEPDRAFLVNAEAPGVLAEAAQRVGAGFVQLSTDYVFDGTRAGAYDESAPTAPLGVYGASKLEGERRVLAAHPSATIVRTAWVYSPFGRNFVKTMLTLAQGRDEVSVVADQRGTPTSALDLADGLLALAQTRLGTPEAGAGEVFHLAGRGETVWAEFAEAVFAAAREHGLPAASVRRIATEDYPTRARRPMNSTLDSRRFEGVFGYRSPEWRSALARVIHHIAEGQE